MGRPPDPPYLEPPWQRAAFAARVFMGSWTIWLTRDHTGVWPRVFPWASAMDAMPAKARLHFEISLRQGSLILGRKTVVMGVLNLTPDSFSDGGQFLEPSKAVERAWEIAAEGAAILDIGGESTRPRSHGVAAEEELRRVLPVLEALEGKYPLPISIDTSKSEVARAALERGVCMINDVTALKQDLELGKMAAQYDAALVLMHMRGTPLNMQEIPPSRDILGEIESWCAKAVARAKKSGVSSQKIILDPGIGFGKTSAQNLEILGHLERLANIGFPLMVGTSRKSFVGQILDRPVDKRLWGTAATVAVSVLLGAHIIRAHDVAAMVEVASIADAIASERFKA